MQVNPNVIDFSPADLGLNNQVIPASGTYTTNFVNVRGKKSFGFTISPTGAVSGNVFVLAGHGPLRSTANLRSVATAVTFAIGANVYSGNVPISCDWVALLINNTDAANPMTVVGYASAQ